MDAGTLNGSPDAEELTPTSLKNGLLQMRVLIIIIIICPGPGVTVLGPIAACATWTSIIWGPGEPNYKTWGLIIDWFG